MANLKEITKRVLKPGKWIHPQSPDGVLNITKEYLAQLADNFNVNPYVPVYRGHIQDSEAERNPELILSKNIKGLQVKNDGLYAKMEVPEEAIDQYNDLSAGIDPEFMDAEKGELIGPTLRHIAFTMSPYIKKLNPMGLSETEKHFLINLSDIQPMTDEKLNKSEEEKEEESKVENQEETSEESTEEESTEETSEDTEETKSDDDQEESDEDESSDEEEESTEEESDSEEEESEIIENSDSKKMSYEELQKRVLNLSQTVAKQDRELNLGKAEKKYDSLLRAGKIAPAMKDTFIELSCQSNQMITLSDGKKSASVSELVHKLFDKMPKIVNLSEKGVDLEQGDNQGVIQLSGDFKNELRELHKDKTDKEFEEYIAKNIETYAKHDKSNK